MIFVKNWQFFHLFILGRIGQENVFYNILDRKTPFQTIKTSTLKSRKNGIFPKRLVHDFCQKLPTFPSFYLKQKKSNQNAFYILDIKNASIDCKNIKLKKSKKWDSSKGLVHDFCPKLPIFPSFYLRKTKPRKYVLQFS